MAASKDSIIDTIQTNIQKWLTWPIKQVLGDDLSELVLGNEQGKSEVKTSISNMKEPGVIMIKGDNLGILPNLVGILQNRDVPDEIFYERVKALSAISTPDSRSKLEFLNVLMGAKHSITIEGDEGLAIRKALSGHLKPRLYLDAIRSSLEEIRMYGPSDNTSKLVMRRFSEVLWSLKFQEDDQALVDCIESINNLITDIKLLYYPSWAMNLIPKVAAFQARLETEISDFINRHIEELQKQLIENSAGLVTTAVLDFIREYSGDDELSSVKAAKFLGNLDTQERIFLVNDKRVRTAITAIFPAFNFANMVRKLNENIKSSKFFMDLSTETQMAVRACDDFSKLSPEIKTLFRSYVMSEINTNTSVQQLVKYIKKPIKLAAVDPKSASISIPGHSVVSFDIRDKYYDFYKLPMSGCKPFGFGPRSCPAQHIVIKMLEEIAFHQTRHLLRTFFSWAPVVAAKSEMTYEDSVDFTTRYCP